MLRHNCDNHTPLVPVINIVIPQGADFDLQFELVSCDNETDTPIDISKYKFYAKIKSSAEDTDIIAKFKQVDVDPTNGIVNLHLSAEETSAIDTGGNSFKDWDELYWDMNMFDGNTIQRVCNGKAFISPGISQ